VKLYDPDFEARLRARVRPAWKAALKKHGSVGPGFWTRHRSLSSALGAFVILIIAANLLEKLVTLRWSPRAIAAYAGVACTAFCVMISGVVRMKIARPKDLPTLLWWPASEELIGLWGWQAIRRFRWGAFFPLLLLLTALGDAAGATPTWSSLPALLLTATLGVIGAAGVVLLPISGRAMQLAGALLVAMLVLLIAQPYDRISSLGEWLDQKADVLVWLHPGGWLVGVFWAALHPQGWRREWLLVVPLLALAESTRYWRRRHCAAVNSAALLEHLQTLAAAEVPAPETVKPHAMDDVPPKGEPPAITPDAEALRDAWRAVLPPLAFEGRVQRWLLARLNARERLLCEALGVALPSWQRISGWGWKLCALAWTLAWLGRALHWTSGGMLTVIGLVLIFTASGMMGVSGVARASDYSVWMPVGYAEIRRLQWKRGAPILVLLSPWLVLAACPVGWLQDVSLWRSALAGLKLLILAASVHPWLVISQYSADSGDTKGWRWSSVRIFANIIAAALATIGGFVGACLPGWPGWVSMAVAVAATWRLYAVHRRYWDRRRFDVGLGAME
jgi:hypothetical protein